MNIKYNIFFTNPLEQFNIIPIISFYIGKFDLSFTNSTTIFLAWLLFFVFIYRSFIDKDSSFCVVPNRWQVSLEKLHKAVLTLVLDTIKSKIGEDIFPFIFFLCVLILSSNIIGLIPNSHTWTSDLVSIGGLCMAIFFGINIIGVNLNELKWFAQFFPPGINASLGLLLVPIELISFSVKPISLSVRLFANMTAGHVLLKVVGWFSMAMIVNGGPMFFIFFIIPMYILIILTFLEMAVALIQAYVFTILVCIYIENAINIH
jgi:ATP synthase subunit 6